jgi:hypothetical protein
MPDNATFLRQGAKEFLRRYPVTFIQIIGASSVGPTAKATWTPPTKGDAAAGQGSVTKAKRVWDVTFSARADPFATVTSPRCPTPVRATLDTNGAGISTFYLPYQNNENYRITLDANGPGGANVHFFMTELVDGCSVYIEGTQDKPTCYHINANAYAQTNDPTQPHHLTALAALAGTNLAGLNSQQVHDIQFGFKSQYMDNRYQNDAAHRPKTVVAGVNLQQAKKVEEQDYMIVPGTANETAFNTTMAALKALQIVPTHVNGKSVDEMRFVTSQGFIFGIRTGVNWKFYVQRKALVEYFHRTHAIGAKFNQAVKGIPRPMISLGMQNIVRDVKQYWPTSKVGRDA